MRSVVLLMALAATSPAATGPPPSDLGALQVQTVPGAEVLWEGVSLGATDEEGRLLIERIPSGRYQVRLRKEGFYDKEIEVVVDAGATTRLHLTLRKLAPPKPAPAPEPRAEPRVRSAQSPPPQVEEAPAEPRPETPAEQPPATATPEMSAPAREPAAESEPGPERAEARSGFPVTPSLLVAALVAGGMGLLLARRRQQPIPLQHPKPVRGPAPADPETISPSEDDTGFIETLRQQEKDLDDGEPGSWRREPEIIDAEFIEVLEANEE